MSRYNNRHFVLIHNKLQRTITLTSTIAHVCRRLDAVTIVWLSARFTDEHRAALDWLNWATTAGFNFFGLEIELCDWDVSICSEFNIISKPNDWSRTVREQAVASGEMSQTEQNHFDFWTQFREYLVGRGSVIRPTSPSTSYWTNVAVGRSNFVLAAWNNMRDGRSGVQFEMTGPD